MDEKDLVSMADGLRVSAGSVVDKHLDGLGVSVAICTHNGASRLPETLAYLARQIVPAALPWEVLVIDNASTDGSAVVARQTWHARPSVPLRIVSESKLGLSHARRRALDAASYSIVSFVDDDNWVSQNWVARTAEMMGANPRVGACGGLGTAVSTSDLPSWFDQLCGCYAVGPQGPAPGNVTGTTGILFGAGLNVRRKAWRQLREAGFDFLLTDRRGTDLSSGGDYELCWALRLAGWRLWYEPTLTFKHALPGDRLTWEYIRRLHRCLGVASTGYDAYVHALHPEKYRTNRFTTMWQWQALRTAIQLRHYSQQLLTMPRCSDGDVRQVQADQKIGRIFGLFGVRHEYRKNFDKVTELSRRLSQAKAAMNVGW
jgi:glycosyltransferase involved in cell wall biosynthesis